MTVETDGTTDGTTDVTTDVMTGERASPPPQTPPISYPSWHFHSTCSAHGLYAHDLRLNHGVTGTTIDEAETDTTTAAAMTTMTVDVTITDPVIGMASLPLTIHSIYGTHPVSPQKRPPSPS